MINTKTFSAAPITFWFKNKLFLLSGVMVFVGIALRLRQYLANLSLWRDEASLALNIINRTFIQLAQPLDDDQGAPLLFLWLQKGMTTVWGPDEYALRFLSLAWGIISIFMFWFIVSKCLQERAALFALALFVLSDPLIEFSAEAKQYSCDVFVGLLALTMLFFLTNHSGKLGYVAAIGYGLLGAIFIWLSHPAIFFLSSIGLAAVYSAYSKGDYRKVKFLVIMGVMWLISFLISYITSLATLTNNAYLLDSWRAGFPPSLSRPFAVLEWTILTFLGMFEYPGNLTAFGLGAFFFIGGVISFYRRDKVILMSLTLPILFTLLASFLSQYPFTNRLILFMVPLLLIPVAEGLDQIFSLLYSSQFRVAAFFLVAIIFFHPLLAAGDYLQKPKFKEEIKPVIEHVSDNWEEGDMIYVYYGAKRPFKYYYKNFGFQKNDYILGIESRYQWVNYLPDLNRL